MSATKYQVLARRYRPQTFREVIGQEPAVTTLKNALRFERAAHAYLFCGSRGVGKTTLARLFAKALNCQEKGADLEPCNRCSSCMEIGSGQSLDVIEIDGASNRGIDDVRQINETACYSPAQGRYKIYIIDEVHMLTKEAFNALLKTLEEPPEKAKFLFATTEPHKVLPTIISRCQRFDLGRIQISQIIGKLEQIAADLSRKAEPEAIHLIASFSDGSLRDAESLFDQILCFAEGVITADAVRKALGLIPQEQFFALDLAFSTGRVAFAFELVDSLFSAGKDLAHFFEQLIEHIRLLTLARLSGEKALILPPDLAARYLESSRLYASSQCLYLLDYLLRTEPQLQKSSCQRVALEAALLHYIQSKNRIPVEILVRRLAELEQSMKGAQSVQELSKSVPAVSSPPFQETSVSLKTAQTTTIATEPPSLPPIPTLKEPPVSIKTAQATAIAPELPSLSPIPTLKELPIPTQATSTPVITPEFSSPTPTPQESTQPPIAVRKPSIPVLKPVPFDPFKPRMNLEKEEKPIPAEPAAKPREENTKGIDKTRHDILMRFAAVELEGTLKLN